MVQLTKHLPSKCEALNSNLVLPKKNKKKKRENLLTGFTSVVMVGKDAC
jgi:hypothetical protein